MLGKNTITRSGKCAAAKVADLVIVSIYVSICRISTNMRAAKCAMRGASVIKGVANAVKPCAAILANGRTRIETNVAAIGIQSAAYGAVGVASHVVGVSKTGSLAANCANIATVNRSYVRSGGNSGFAANVACCVAITCIGVSNGLALNYESLAAVLANRTASSLGSVLGSIGSCTGGATLDITISIASCRVGVSSKRLAATFNYADTVAIKGIVVVANVIANSAADVANRVVVIVGVGERLRCAAGSANLSIAIAFPDVLGCSLISATVIADLIAIVGILVLGICLSESADIAGLAASEIEIVLAISNRSCTTAVNAGNGASLLIRVRSFAGCVAEFAISGAGVQPGVNQVGLASQLAANVTRKITTIVIGVNHISSDLAANAASGGAAVLVGVNQVGACSLANVTDSIASAVIGVLNGFDRRGTNRANRAIAGCASVVSRCRSLNGYGTAIADCIALRRVSVVDGAEAGSEREKRQSHGQKQEENSFHVSLQKIVF